MGKVTGVEWTDHTFSPWWGCTKVGPGCENCYADAWDARFGPSHWGAGVERRLIKDWSGPAKWNRLAEKAGKPAWMFVASMCDVFDNEVPPEWRTRLWDLLRPLKWLRVQIVTKRIGNAKKMLPPDWEENFKHCGLIATIVNQEEADRDIPKLLDTPAAWRGLSMEPLLGPVDLTRVEAPNRLCFWNVLDGSRWNESGALHGFGRLDWIIIGGESGGKAREFHLEWAFDLLGQCANAGVPCFIKQIGDKPMASGQTTEGGPLVTVPVQASPKGKDMEEWPAYLRVRQMPQVYG